MRTLKVLVLIVLFALLSGCILFSNYVKVNKAFMPAKGHAYYTKLPVHLQIGKITDARDYENPKVIVHKRDGLEDTLPSGVIADRPVTEIIHQYLQLGVGQLGYNTNSSVGGYILSGKLNKVQYRYDQSFAKTSPVVWLNINLKLLDTKTNKIVWQKQMLSFGRVPGKYFPQESEIGEAFNNAVITLVHQLQQSKPLYRATHSY